MIFFLSSVILFSACHSLINDDAKQATLLYCGCASKSKIVDADSLYRYCNEVVAQKYRLFRIYIETRDKDINKLYPKKTVDSVNMFMDLFRRYDTCSSKYGVKKHYKSDM